MLAIILSYTNAAQSLTPGPAAAPAPPAWDCAQPHARSATSCSSSFAGTLPGSSAHAGWTRIIRSISWPNGAVRSISLSATCWKSAISMPNATPSLSVACSACPANAVYFWPAFKGFLLVLVVFLPTRRTFPSATGHSIDSCGSSLTCWSFSGTPTPLSIFSTVRTSHDCISPLPLDLQEYQHSSEWN
jgi:hypothetical protein